MEKEPNEIVLKHLVMTKEQYATLMAVSRARLFFQGQAYLFAVLTLIAGWLAYYNDALSWISVSTGMLAGALTCFAVATASLGKFRNAIIQSHVEKASAQE